MSVNFLALGAKQLANLHNKEIERTDGVDFAAAGCEYKVDVQARHWHENRDGQASLDFLQRFKALRIHLKEFAAHS